MKKSTVVPFDDSLTVQPFDDSLHVVNGLSDVKPGEGDNVAPWDPPGPLLAPVDRARQSESPQPAHVGAGGRFEVSSS
jgi:hypothetical protein